MFTPTLCDNRNSQGKLHSIRSLSSLQHMSVIQGINEKKRSMLHPSICLSSRQRKEKTITIHPYNFGTTTACSSFPLFQHTRITQTQTQRKDVKKIERGLKREIFEQASCKRKVLVDRNDWNERVYTSTGRLPLGRPRQGNVKEIETS